MSGPGRFLNAIPELELALSFDVAVDLLALQGDSQGCKHYKFPLVPQPPTLAGQVTSAGLPALPLSAVSIWK